MSSGIVCYILRTRKSSFFHEGSLLSVRDRGRNLYAHHRPNSSAEYIKETCICNDADLAPVLNGDYPYIVRIQNPENRLDVYIRKLTWGKKLREGDHAFVKLRKPLAAEEYAQVIIRYKDNTKLGLKFGVEIIVSPLHFVHAIFLFFAAPKH